MQPGLEYFERQQFEDFFSSFQMCKNVFTSENLSHAARLSALEQSLAAVPFLRNAVDSLKTEVPAYLVKAASTSADITLLEWWK